MVSVRVWMYSAEGLVTFTYPNGATNGFEDTIDGRIVTVFDADTRMTLATWFDPAGFEISPPDDADPRGGDNPRDGNGGLSGDPEPLGGGPYSGGAMADFFKGRFGKFEPVQVGVSSE